MQPPHTFIAVAGGPPDAIVSLHLADRLAERREARWARRGSEPTPLAASRRVRFAMAARRLVMRPA
jgi:hypothetical protein